MKAILLALCVTALTLPSMVHGLYFYMEKDSQKCFKDELVKNSVSIQHFSNLKNTKYHMSLFPTLIVSV
jgi:hypothetical protein